MPANPFNRLQKLSADAFTVHPANYRWNKVHIACRRDYARNCIVYTLDAIRHIQDDLLDTLHWLRQTNALVLGLMWGLIGITGALGFIG